MIGSSRSICIACGVDMLCRRDVFSFFCRGQLAVLLFCGTLMSLEAQGVVKQFYHNTTSFYNALFIVREKHSAIEKALREREAIGQTEVIPVYLRYDSTQVIDLNEDIEDCIKKSSMVLQYHPTSKWSDEAYLLLGYARHHHNERQEAVKTFQYLARKGRKYDMRMAAQVALLRIYVHDSLLQEAKQVVTYIARDPPREGENRLHYLLGIAYLAQHLGRIEDLIRYLEHALPLARRDKYIKSRLYFILGQSYERIGKYAPAYVYYRKCARRLLPYDFYLEARLRSWATLPLPNEKALTKLRKRFRKERREDKNKELRHKIHFHWARMEKKEGNLYEAQQQYAASIAVNSNNSLLLGRSHEELAHMYYSAEQVPKAAAHYDSAARALPKEARGYRELQKRSEIFMRLGVAYETREREDSLLRLSGLSQDSLIEILKAEQAKQAEAARMAKESSKRAEAPSFSDTRPENDSFFSQPPSNSSWYFYDQPQLIAGRKSFEKVWGRRSLIDSWRKSKLQSFTLSRPEERPKEQPTTDEEDYPTVADSTAIDMAALLADIPQDEATKQAAQQRLQDAYYDIGNIYYYELEERSKGRATFIGLIQRFSNSMYRARLLYLLAKDDSISVEERNSYAATLEQNYPDSVYTKLLHNPNYLVERAAAVRELLERYQEAYTAYSQGDYLDARRTLRSSLDMQSESNSFTDNATLLDILVDAKTGVDYLYQYRLHNFLQDFPKSERIEAVKELLIGAENVQARKVYSSKPEYFLKRRESHGLLWACTHRDLANAMRDWLRDATKTKPGLHLPLRAEVILLDKDKWVVFVPGFSDAESAMQFLDAYWASELPATAKQRFSSQEARPFAVSESNLSMVFAAKDIDYYEDFFQAHYTP